MTLKVEVPGLREEEPQNIYSNKTQSNKLSLPHQDVAKL